MTRIGIHDLDMATTQYVVSLDDLAGYTGVDPDKYKVGLGQETFSMPAPDEDIVTMGAAAAAPILARNGVEGIRTLMFATESGVDQSKSAGVFVHDLLELPPTMRVVELKQACYSGTAALQAALGIVSRNPSERVLVIMSDVARYQLDTAGEPTHGAGAVAMLVSADPQLLEIEPLSGICTHDIDDFWRPNDSTTAVVDGALSMRAYLTSLGKAWADLSEQGGPAIESIERWVYHQPFSKMATKAHKHLARVTGAQLSEEQIESGLYYNRHMGNSYTASLYAGIIGLLELEEGLDGKRIGCFSYGSGSVAELFTAIVQPGYRDHIDTQRAERLLLGREPIDVETYRALHSRELPSTLDAQLPHATRGPYRLKDVTARARHYERTQES